MKRIKKIVYGRYVLSVFAVMAIVFFNIHLTHAQNVRIAKWKNDKKAVLTLQFDDSTPGQATLGIPALNQRNIVGTWFVNPGRDAFNTYIDYWENVAPAGGQELANHTMNHSGADTYEEIVYEVGEASRIIWGIRNEEDFSSLIAFNRGGGTSWDEDDLASVLEEYKNIDRQSYLGTSVLAKSVLPGSNADQMFEIIPHIIADSIVGHVHFHGIAAEDGNPPMDWGNGAVWINELEIFLDRVVEIQDEVWVDGFIAVYKYISERETATISMTQQTDDRYTIEFVSDMDPLFYNEPLTILVDLPLSWQNCQVTHNGMIKSYLVQNGALMFDALPNKGEITLENEVLSPPPTVIATETDICNGDHTSLSYTGGAGDTFSWYSGTCAGTFEGLGNNLTVYPSVETTYYGRWEAESGNSACGSVTIVVRNMPSQPDGIVGENTPIEGSTELYSVTNVQDVDYIWTLPEGWTGSSSTNEIAVIVGSSGGTISVTPSNSCGNGTARTLPVSVNNPIPVANANGPYNGETNVPIDFSSAGSNDSNGTIEEYLWDFGDGNTSNSANPSHIYVVDGVFAVALTVTDNEGATGTSSTTATISSGSQNQPPTVNANGPYSGQVGVAVNFSYEGTTDPDGTLTGGFWDFGDGTTSTNPNPAHTYQTEGTYSVVLSVTDNEGATSTDETVATIAGGSSNQAPIVNANGPYSGNVGESISFSFAGTSDPDGSLATGFWDFGDGTTSTSPNPMHVYTAAGTYTAILSVTDNEGATATDNADVTIFGSGNIAPDANANGSYSADENVQINFSSTGSSDADGTIVSYLWDFGDGSSSIQANPSYAYSTAGTYSVVLTVTDNEGATGSDQTTATISGSGVPVILIQSYFETGWDNWTDGGSDVERYFGPFSYEGDYSLSISNNSGGASSIISPIFDVRNFNQLTIDFYFFADGMEIGEEFLVGYYNGSSWTAIGTYVCGTYFENGGFYNLSISISDEVYTFPTNARFAMQCNASDNSDLIYIDQVIITASSGISEKLGDTINKVKVTSDTQLTQAWGYDVKIYPNPASEVINLFYVIDKKTKAEIYSINGKLIKEIQITQNYTEINISELKKGMYVLKVYKDKEYVLKRFLKQ